jgi:hypothetical protein
MKKSIAKILKTLQISPALWWGIKKQNHKVKKNPWANRKN